MTKTPSQAGLAQATNPDWRNPESNLFAGRDPWGHEGTPGGPVMSPEWSQFFDMLNQAAPGGITTPRLSSATTKPMSNG